MPTSIENLTDDDRALRRQELAVIIAGDPWKYVRQIICGRSRGLHSHEIDELTSQVLCSIACNQHSFKGNCRARTWIYEVAKNAHLNYCKKKSRERLWLSPLEVPEHSENSGMANRLELPCPGLTGEEALLNRELGQKIQKAIATLSEVSRKIFIDCVIYELSYEECATKYGIPLGTVKVRVHRARLALQARLQHYLIE